MRSIDRVKAAMSCEVPDRVPVITYTSIDSGNLSGELTNYIRNNADAQYEYHIGEFLYTELPCTGMDAVVDVKENIDGWMTRTYTSSIGEHFSNEFKWGEGKMYRSYRKWVIDDPSVTERLLTLPYLKPDGNSSFIASLEFVDSTSDLHNTDNEFCWINLTDPLSFLATHCNPADFAIWSRTDRDKLLNFAKEQGRRFCEYLEYSLSHYRMDCVFLLGGPEYAIPPLMSPQDFEDFVFDIDKEIIDLLHKYGKKVAIHCHGKIKNFVQRFIAMGADAIHPLEPVGATGDCDLAEIKALYGKDICLIGNIQYADLASLPAEGIDKLVKSVMDNAKEGGGFILSPACPLYCGESTRDIVERNVRAMIDAGLRYGKYQEE